MQRVLLYIALIPFSLASCGDQEPVNTTTVKRGFHTITEDSLPRFVAYLANMPVSQSKAELGFILSSIKHDSAKFIKLVNFLDKPFSNPNSKFRNEELFIFLLQAQLRSAWYSEPERDVINGKLQLALQNRTGNPANDFIFLTPQGLRIKMYAVDAPYTLLYFYNPECHACKETKAQIEGSDVLNHYILSGRLKVLAIYTDADASIWRKHLSENPPQWVNGRDSAEYLWKNKVYDLRAIPTLYLLDKNKIVLLKDATVQHVEEILATK